MLLRQVLRCEIQGYRLRKMRRAGDPQPRSPRAHGPHQPGVPRGAHLVLQGHAQPRLATLLGIKSSSLQQVIYFQKYIVVDPGTTPLEYMEILSEEAYRKAVEKYGDDFKAMMGAEAIQELVRHLDIDSLIADLREELAGTRAKQKIEKITKRLSSPEDLKKSGNDPQWMIQTTIPVIPPDLRPLGAAGKRQLCHLRPQRPLPSRYLP